MTGDDVSRVRIEDTRVLEAMADADCRAILAATDDDPRTAAELVDRCGIPISTVYRKVKTLSRAGLLAERTRIRASGPNCSEFALRVGTVHVDLAGMCACEVDHVVDPHEDLVSIDGPGVGGHRRASTDGGTEPPEDAEPSVDVPD